MNNAKGFDFDRYVRLYTLGETLVPSHCDPNAEESACRMRSTDVSGGFIQIM